MKTPLKTLVMIAALASPLFLFLWEQVQATRLGYAVSRTQVELRRSRERADYLRLELDRLQAPESVADAAQRRLGMAPPTPESVVVLGTSRPAAVPAAAPRVADAATDASRYLSSLPPGR
ncbi:MAG: hypothetical protein KGL53_06690 [Elusimicrobia bacterium]|nr:hypothetical protein [Elusimicrobiota bacterium]